MNGETVCEKNDELVGRIESWLQGNSSVPASMVTELIDALREREETVRHLWGLGMTPLEYQRLVEWIKDANRQPPEHAFTSGAVRTACRAIQESGVLNPGAHFPTTEPKE